MGKLYFKQGTMGSSKSTFLLTTAYSFEERGIPFICIKSETDTRDGYGIIKSKVGISRECTVIPNDMDIYTWFKDIRTKWLLNGCNCAEWILVDEAQFLLEKQVDQLAKIVDEFDVNIICFGLRTDFNMHLFEGSKRLFELSDDIDEFKISCKCGRKAIVNARVDSDGRVITNGEQIVLGGDDMYVPMCRKCFNEAIKNGFRHE